jgi:hypothetical protein
MTTGRTASWNAEAASGCVDGEARGARRRARPLRPTAGAEPAFYDMQALWAGRRALAANRLLRLLGSGDLFTAAASSRPSSGAWERLKHLPGAYRVGAARPPSHAGRRSSRRERRPQPSGPRARGHQAAAAGIAGPARSGSSPGTGAIGLALLLDSEPAGDNIALSTMASETMPAAQKHGWIAAARHSVAVVYGPRGRSSSRLSPAGRAWRSATPGTSAGRSCARPSAEGRRAIGGAVDSIRLPVHTDRVRACGRGMK